MKNLLTALMMVAALMLLAAPAVADWNPGDPDKMHFPQLPDLTERGMDVLANYPYYSSPDQPPQDFGKVLADDWQCSQSGLVRDIHIWGSWLDDRVPLVEGADGTVIADPGAVSFKLSIHENREAGKDGLEWSHPGQELWGRTFDPGQYTWRVYAGGPNNPDLVEQFYDPNQNEIIGQDWTAYQYNFYMDPSDTSVEQPFPQEQDKIYWLDVMAIPHGDDPTGIEPPPIWGWKTADLRKYPDPYTGEHFMDDAVFADTFPGAQVDPVMWQHMHHPWDPHESIDMAFVITPEPGTLVLLGMGLLAFLGFAWRRRRRA